ncbi:1,6-Anhydro-N-acetylmuramate kinase [Amphibacillus marinus]|uniref:Anhydro-N-acetylmuramic acid kinase n=1 Tax=Amphibacillus marinus TaxID=872970 RepID=A0A1H8QRP4_9BACI|nr:anhydro-N-acetylmuramic acid kinase AnmK [Amphibacillus marinus]SEO56687.1 1,6-Anhydro-N-acetylmuramate kinase [Amphibacillus marinus]
MAYFIGVDAGGTKTISTAYDSDGTKLNQHQEGFGNIRVNRETALEHITQSIDALIHHYGNETLKGITIGIAGLPDGEQEMLQAHFYSRYLVEVKIVSDYLLAYKSTFADQDGLLVIAGTGFVMYGEASGESVKFGGWGHLLGDIGSGYDLVIRTIKASIDYFEEKSEIPVLMKQILHQLNMQEIEEIKHFIYGSKKDEIAKLAPIVLQHAKEGNQLATQIIKEASEAIADKIRKFIDRKGTSASKLCLTGGILENAPILVDYILADLDKQGIVVELVKAADPTRAVLYYNTKKQINNQGKYAVGLMSGTSLDGIDTVLCRISGVDHNTSIEVVDFQTYPYTLSVKEKVERMVSGDHIRVSELSSLNFELSYEYSNCVKEICQQNQLNTRDLFYVASHGQTVFHEAELADRQQRSTLQLGEPAVIAYQTEATVVSNFRAKDVAANGEGAPLVPFSEYVLYTSDKTRILLNIGGISNLTLIPAAGSLDALIGFDTGPGNMMINEAMQLLFNYEYDDQGKIAETGELIEPMLEELMSHWFIDKAPPKSTGRDEFGKVYTEQMVNKYLDNNPADIVHTLTRFTARSIGKHIIEFLQIKHSIDELIVSGGGTHNHTLIRYLQNELAPEGIKVLTQEDLGFSSDAKEAIAFVILGNQTMHKRHSNVPAVTGANRHTVLGSVTYPD